MCKSCYFCVKNCKCVCAQNTAERHKKQEMGSQVENVRWRTGVGGRFSLDTTLHLSVFDLSA